MRHWHKPTGRGDTIVEVMISMTVLAVVVAAAYAVSTRSFQSSLNSQYRDQAISYAQQQLELVKEADNNSPATLSQYEPPAVASNTAFCINPSTKASQLVDTTNKCLFNSQYTVSVTFDSASKKFKVVTSWTSANNRPQQSILFYRPNDSFSYQPNASSPAGQPISCPTASASCASTQTNQPAVGMSASKATVNVGDTDTISWAITNVAAGSCTATGPGGFNAVDPNTNPGPFTTTALTTVGNNTFSIACKDNANNSVSGSTIVSVVNPTPVVTTGSASSITYNSATLNGTVNPNGFATTYQFNYGTTSAYGTTTAATSAGAGSSNAAASTAISGLGASTTYHFRVCATNAYGTNCGNDATFTSANNPAPVVTTGSASSITYNSATLNGTVNPNGLATTYQFKYGTTTAYGLTSGTGSAGSGSSNVGASQAISGLSASTLYHFQLCATNSGDTNCGADATFTTTAAPPVINGFSSNQGGNIYTLQGAYRTFGISTSNATSCNISGYGVNSTATINGNTGAITVYPNQTYTLNCSGPGGAATPKSVSFGYVHSSVYIYHEPGWSGGYYEVQDNAGTWWGSHFMVSIQVNSGYASTYYNNGNSCLTWYSSARYPDPMPWNAEEYVVPGRNCQGY